MTQKGSRGFTQIGGGKTKSKLQIAFSNLIAIVEAGRRWLLATSKLAIATQKSSSFCRFGSYETRVIQVIR